MSSDFKICIYSASSGAVVSLDLLAVKVDDPQAGFPKFDQVTLGSGLVRDQGAGAVEWRFVNISAAQRNQLRAFIGRVFVVTPDEGGVFTLYDAVLVWPQNENQMLAGIVDELIIRFMFMVEV